MAPATIHRTWNTKHNNAAEKQQSNRNWWHTRRDLQNIKQWNWTLYTTNNEQITQGNEVPPQWTEGALIHIRKKEDKQECQNYRPICLTQIIYKIWPKLRTNQLGKILHLMTSSTKYGYNSKPPTIDAIVKNRTCNSHRDGQYSHHPYGPNKGIWLRKQKNTMDDTLQSWTTHTTDKAHKTRKPEYSTPMQR